MPSRFGGQDREPASLARKITLRDQAVVMRLMDAIRPVLSAHNSGVGHVTEDQITEAWAAYDAARMRFRPKTVGDLMDGNKAS